MKIFDFNIVKGVALISIALQGEEDLSSELKNDNRYYPMRTMLVTGCISAQLLFLVSKTYEPVTATWLPTGGMLISGWLKLLQADPTSGRETGF